MGEVNQSVKLLGCTPNAEEVVAMAARLCYSAADIEALQHRVEARDQTRFLENLIAMGHLSAVEHASYTFGVEGVSRSLLAQITRHRIASFSVKSQRYVGLVSDDGSTFNYVVPPRIQALGEEAVAQYGAQMRTIQGWYDEWARRLGQGEQSFEDARFILPNAAETKLVFTMNARELMHFFSLRCCNRAQWEIRALAWKMLSLVKAESPVLFAHAGPSCVFGACAEGKKTCGQAAQVRRDYLETFAEAD